MREAWYEQQGSAVVVVVPQVGCWCRNRRLRGLWSGVRCQGEPRGVKKRQGWLGNLRSAAGCTGDPWPDPDGRRWPPAHPSSCDPHPGEHRRGPPRSGGRQPRPGRGPVTRTSADGAEHGSRRTLAAMRCLALVAGRHAVRRRVAVAAIIAILVLSGCGGQAPRPGPAAESARDGFAVLVFTRTTGYRHASIANGVAAIRRLGATNGFTVAATEDPTQIQDNVLQRYRAVVFLSSTGNPLGPAQQAALERWVEAGGGWVGVHAAADAHYDWPWYGELVGAWFRRHPRVQRATVRVTDGAIRRPGRFRRPGPAPMSGTTSAPTRAGGCGSWRWSTSRPTRVVAWASTIPSAGP